MTKMPVFSVLRTLAFQLRSVNDFGYTRVRHMVSSGHETRAGGLCLLQLNNLQLGEVGVALKKQPLWLREILQSRHIGQLIVVGKTVSPISNRHADFLSRTQPKQLTSLAEWRRPLF